MKTILGEEGYFTSAAKKKSMQGFDYMLFRQDMNGNETVLFGKDEIEKIGGMVSEGKIIVHPNYLLCCANDELKDSAPDFGCYATVLDNK
jgi:hypothetical protein